MAGAAREVLEETGVRAEPLEYLTNIDLVRHAPDGAVAVHYLLAAVLCDFTGGTPLAADDAKAAAWVPRAAILEGGLAMSERVAELMLLAEARLQVRRAAPRL
jgi:ADP-ribose pyrophosphatase YjhB (NUDIX family)